MVSEASTYKSHFCAPVCARRGILRIWERRKSSQDRKRRSLFLWCANDVVHSESEDLVPGFWENTESCFGFPLPPATIPPDRQIALAPSLEEIRPAKILLHFVLPFPPATTRQPIAETGAPSECGCNNA